MTIVYLNIGSNQGDRYAQIEHAVALIAAAYPKAYVRRSAFIESEPWGFQSEHRFVNLGLALDFEGAVEPFEMLACLQKIEKQISTSLHRNPDGTYADRAIDIDMIAIEGNGEPIRADGSIAGIRINSPQLTLPHPQAHLRDFVMTPLRDLSNKA